VPRSFTADRPAVFYTHEALDMSIEAHPLGKTLPKSTNDVPSIQAGPNGFRVFAARENAPETLEDFLCEDLPQLSLHVTSFSDATLVGLSWPHTLMDVMGQQALLRCWSLVLAGREDEVPSVLGAKEDAICTITDAPPLIKSMEEDIDKIEIEAEDFKLGKKQLTGWAMLSFGLRFAWDLLWYPVVETRTIFLPKNTIDQLRHQAQKDLAADDGGEEKLFVSEGDVLTAWAARLVASSLPYPRPITVLHALNARFRLPSLIRAPGVYIQNMAVAAFAFFSPEQLASPQGLGHLALENRRSLAEQATSSQVLAQLRHLRSFAKFGLVDPNMVCADSSDTFLMPVTNWTRADFFTAVDFEPAVVRAGETKEKRKNAPGTMVFHHAQSMRQAQTVRNVVIVLGKNHEEGYWITGILMPMTWSKIEEEIGRMIKA
jgi:hypothetical protein